MASEKQMSYIKTLYESFSKMASTIEDEALVKDLMEKILPYKDTLVSVLKDEDIDFKTASDLIGLLKGILDANSPSKIRWKKIGSEWVVAGDSSVIFEGAEVEVTSKKGTQKVTIGRIHSTDGNMTFGIPKKDDDKAANIEPGFYWKDDQIIEAYFTKNGFLVARTIVNNKRGDYLGKAGLKGLDKKLTLEEIQEFGRQTGVCMVCSRELTDPVSIEMGIGPICLNKGGF